MASPTTPGSLRPVPGRNVTKRWKEAQQVDYGGDDWGEDEYAASAPAHRDQRSQGWTQNPPQQSHPPPAQSHYYPQNRSAATQSPMRSTGRPSFDQASGGRPSFDQGDDRRTLSMRSGGFEGPYPNAQRAPYPDPQHEFDSYDPEPQYRANRGVPPLQVHTQNRPPSRDKAPYTAPYLGQDSRMTQYPDTRAGPFSAAMAHNAGRRSHSSGRPSHAEIFGRHESPARPGSRGSQGSSPARQQLPPRKSSLSQQAPPVGILSSNQGSEMEQPTASTSDVKPLPFLRPIDIWKRHEEEQKERRSQDSARPSIDSSTSRDRALSTTSKPRDIQAPGLPPTITQSSSGKHSEQNQDFSPAFDSEAEQRKENVTTSSQQPVGPESATTPGRVSPAANDSEPQSASSDYSNRPDPASAESLHSRPSIREADSSQQEPPYAQYTHSRPHLPDVSRISGFGSDLFDRNRRAEYEGLDGTSHPPVPTQEASAPFTRGLGSGESSFPNAPQTGLHHNTSHGYRSMVQQAFDESQREPPTPVSAVDTLPRSNSATTSDISPIVSRIVKAPPPATKDSWAPIKEEHLGESHLESSQSLQSNDLEQPQSVPLKPGFKRDTATPIYDNSPAKTAFQVNDPDPTSLPRTTAFAPFEDNSPASKALQKPDRNPRPASPATGFAPLQENGLASIALPKNEPTPTRAGYERLYSDTQAISTSDLPSPPTVFSPLAPNISIDEPERQLSRLDSAVSVDDRPSPGLRSTSAEYQDWQAQRRQFNEKLGITTESPSTPGIPSPISRSDSPTKPTVRELSGRLETRSGRSSPINIDPSRSMEPPRPLHDRLESFRPSIPGGWQSFSTNAPTPQHEVPASAPKPFGAASLRPAVTSRTDTTESQVPRAGPPREENTAVRAAWGAAAAAGSALAGAFSGVVPSSTKAADQESIDTSDDESRPPRSVSRDGVSRSGTPNIEPTTSTASVVHAPPSPLPPPPLPKDTPSETPESGGFVSTMSYFPAPLRTSKSNEIKAPSRPPVPAPMPEVAVPHEKDNEKLRQEIVESLTPTSSQYIPAPPDQMSAQPASNMTADETFPPGDGEDGNLPRSYDSYWNDREKSAVTLEPEMSQPAASTTKPPHPGFLDQRFSWERDQSPTETISNTALANLDSVATPNSAQETSAKSNSPDTIKAPQRNDSPVSVEGEEQTRGPAFVSGGMPKPEPLPKDLSETSTGRPSIDQSRISPSMDAGTSRTPTGDFQIPGAFPAKSVMSTITSTTPSVNWDGGNTTSSSSPSTQEVPFRAILGMDNSEEKLRAYSANRQHYANSDCGLEKWLHYMGSQSPENADILASNGSLPQDRLQAISEHRPSPSKTPFSRITLENHSRSDSGNSGTKQLQKFGSKAGFAAKGLLAKGKDKLRTASSGGDKGILANRRRSSAGPMISPVPEESPQHSSYSSAPPQIPEQALGISPVDEDSWSLPYTKPGDQQEESAKDTSAPALWHASIIEREKLSRKTPEKRNSWHSQITVPNPSTARDASPVPPLPAVPHDRDAPSRSNSAVTRPEGAEGGSRTEAVEDTNHLDEGVTDSANPNSLDPDEQDAIFSNLLQHTDPKLNDTLAPPQNNRHSTVSDVSSPSRGPNTAEEANRGISPTLANHLSRAEEDPATSSQLQPNYTEGAEQAQQAEATQQRPEEVSSNHSAHGDAQRTPPSRIGPDTQIVPVADLSARRREDSKLTQARPFSFAATNVLEPEHHSIGTADPRNDRRNIVSPHDNAFDKDISTVSDVASGNRTSKSYSRPFATDPNVENHPAFRETSAATDRSQIHPPESPLPSARRPPEDFHQHRQQSTQNTSQSQSPSQSQSEGQYRIPGPYGQEYRSPKQPPQGLQQRQWPNAQQHQSQPGQPPMQQLYQQIPRPSDRPSMPPQEKSRLRSIGGLLRNRSSSRSRKDGNELEDQRNGKRNSFLRTKSRQDSVSSSQRSHSLRGSESRDQVNSLPRWKANESLPEEPPKKKRHSGFGALFSRGTKPAQPQRSSTVQSNSSGPGKNSAMRNGSYHSQVSSQPQDRGRQNPENSRGMPPPADGHYGQSPPYGPQAQQPQYPASAFPHGPDSVGGQYPQQTPARYATNPQNASSYTPPYGPPPGQQYSQEPREQGQDNQRPSDLRVDTGIAQGRHPPTSGPATAPPVAAQSAYQQSYAHTQPSQVVPSSHANRAISYGYDDRQAPRTTQYPAATTTTTVTDDSAITTSSTTRAPNQVTFPAANVPTGVGMPSSVSSARKAPAPSHNHALDLHKRSRSPRNGRRPSEDSIENKDAQSKDPANQLGTFKNRTSPGEGITREGRESGEVQEKPWRIDLPSAEEEERERMRKNKQMQLERGGGPISPTPLTASPTRDVSSENEAQRPLTVAEKIMGVQRPLSPSYNSQTTMRSPLTSTSAAANARSTTTPTSAGGASAVPAGQERDNAKVGGKRFEVAELPGSKAEGYESEEEIPMSATAYPGQEWMPMDMAAAGYGRWDD